MYMTIKVMCDLAIFSFCLHSCTCIYFSNWMVEFGELNKAFLRKSDQPLQFQT